MKSRILHYLLIVKTEIWKDLENRHTDPDVVQVLNIATFFDPRFKDRHLLDKENTMECIKEESLQYYWSALAKDFSGEVVISSDEPDIPPTK